MRTRTIFLALAAFAALFARDAAAQFTGPTSPYYLDDYNNKTIYVVQRTSVINSFAWAYDTTDPYGEATLAVSSTVNTRPFPGLGSSTGAGGQYTLSGTPTGVSEPYQKPAGITSEVSYDGTSDGAHNYYVQFSATDTSNNHIENVYQASLTWQNPTLLFSVPLPPFSSGENYEGIAYDPANQSLWISGYNNPTIRDYSLTGTLLSSFNPGLQTSTALGFDPADDTLWLSNGLFSSLRQYSTSGTLLQIGTPTGLPSGQNYFSGDFSILAAVPEPSAVILLGTIAAALALAQRRKRSKV